jgi:peptidoglycan/LPS O-acetylase OafA/YrhL
VGLWLVIAVAVCAFAWPWRATPSGAFAIGVTGSAIVYVLSYFPFGVSAEFRYGYWCVLASLAGAMAVIAVRHRRAPAPRHDLV